MPSSGTDYVSRPSTSRALIVPACPPMGVVEVRETPDQRHVRRGVGADHGLDWMHRPGQTMIGPVLGTRGRRGLPRAGRCANSARHLCEDNMIFVDFADHGEFAPVDIAAEAEVPG